MFGFFKKKPSAEDSAKACSALARNATIDVVLEKGDYKAFLITIDTDLNSFAHHSKHSDAKLKFIQTIEERIAHGEYDDPSAGIDMVEEMRKMTGWKANTQILRAVVGISNQQIFSWNPVAG